MPKGHSSLATVGGVDWRVEVHSEAQVDEVYACTAASCKVIIEVDHADADVAQNVNLKPRLFAEGCQLAQLNASLGHQQSALRGVLWRALLRGGMLPGHRVGGACNDLFKTPRMCHASKNAKDSSD
eukprot:CAMPEP_0194531472 /NCGR_PEP_ID=MMETSP0253-20130528/68772_1 /TAXON_ID=2966 /ORGANISM="Noctiluca scintillans" /LENGTH=125 /DNA_ID=CAMNT_0039376827 /DNA_START=134 /DNA_END=508 /DNA_ORIENTATION=+